MLKGNQKKLDINKNNKIDKGDFKLPDFCNLLVAIAYAEFLLNPLLFNWLTSLSIIFGIMKF